MRLCLQLLGRHPPLPLTATRHTMLPSLHSQHWMLRRLQCLPCRPVHHRDRSQAIKNFKHLFQWRTVSSTAPLSTHTAYRSIQIFTTKNLTRISFPSMVWCQTCPSGKLSRRMRLFLSSTLIAMTLHRKEPSGATKSTMAKVLIREGYLAHPSPCRRLGPFLTCPTRTFRPPCPTPLLSAQTTRRLPTGTRGCHRRICLLSLRHACPPRVDLRSFAHRVEAEPLRHRVPAFALRLIALRA